MTETSTTTITAVPCGKDRDGQPLKARQYVVDHRREDWGDGRTRIFVRRPDLDARPGQGCFAPEVVRTDSIIETEPGRLVQCSDPMCTHRATRQAYSALWDDRDPWNAAGFAAFCAGHAPVGSWPLDESVSA